jgi:hypothetical protein
MSEAAKHRHERERGGGYRLLIAAIVNQAVKDGAAWFFETETGDGCCAVAGVDPARLGARKATLNAQQR